MDFVEYLNNFLSERNYYLYDFRIAESRSGEDYTIFVDKLSGRVDVSEISTMHKELLEFVQMNNLSIWIKDFSSAGLDRKVLNTKQLNHSVNHKVRFLNEKNNWVEGKIEQVKNNLFWVNENKFDFNFIKKMQWKD